MTEPVVQDARRFHGFSLPPSLKVWLLLAGAAVAVVAILAIGGGPAPPAPFASLATAAGPVTNLDPAQVRQLQARLVDDLAREPRAALPAAADLSPRPPRSVAVTPARGTTADAARDETLFASNVVVSHGKAAETARPAPRADEDFPRQPAPVSLDDITRSVLRTMGPPQTATPAALDAAPPPAAVAPPAAGAHVIFEGTIIDAVLVTRLDGSFQGPVNALVSAAIYAADRTLVAPAGSRVLGTAKAVTDRDAGKLAVAFHRLLLPNGSAVSLDQFTGLSQRGDAGIAGKVNRHYLQTFGAAAAIGFISGLSQSIGGSFGNDNNRTVVIAGGVGDATSQAANQVLARFLNRLPTITIEGGTRLRVYVTGDLHMPAYSVAPIRGE